jgi:hypothetical protein
MRGSPVARWPHPPSPCRECACRTFGGHPPHLGSPPKWGGKRLRPPLSLRLMAMRRAPASSTRPRAAPSWDRHERCRLVLAPPGARMPDGREGAYHFGGSMLPRANARLRDRALAPLPRGIGMSDAGLTPARSRKTMRNNSRVPEGRLARLEFVATLEPLALLSQG